MENLLNFIKTCLYGIFAYLGIKTGKVEVLFYLMMIDTFLGIVKALKLGEKFSFKYLTWGLITKMILLLIPMIVALVAKSLDYNFKYFVIVIMNILIVNEGISCITNILSIKSGRKIENTDYVTKMLFSLKQIFTSWVKTLVIVIEKNNTKK